MKRGFDFILAAAGLIILAIPLAAIALFVRARLGSPVLFRHERAGWRGRPFTLIKFRTMIAAVPGQAAASEESRLTSSGRWLRRSSLDELPQLWNVVMGDMSLVGPRPLPTLYLSRYSPVQARRLEVRPGLTGWAQINGRNAIDWDTRLAFDVWYVDHRSFWLDCRILFRTVGRVVRFRDTTPTSSEIMEEFRGLSR